MFADMAKAYLPQKYKVLLIEKLPVTLFQTCSKEGTPCGQ